MKFSDGCAFLNSVANRPDVFPLVAMSGQKTIDLSPIWSYCIGIEDEQGGFLFQRIVPGFFEVHTLFPASGGAVKKTAEALQMMFCATECREIVTRVPATNRAANLLARKAGMRHAYSIPLGFDGLVDRIDCDHFSLSLWSWIVGNKLLMGLGSEFHDRLEAEIGDLSHPLDEAHNAFVGYIRACLAWGNVGKGVQEYNIWAAVSGYQPVEYDGQYIKFDNVRIDHDEQIVLV